MNFLPGDKLPLCIGVDRERTFYSFDAQAGRAAVLLLAGGVPAPSLDSILGPLASRRAALLAHGADLLVLQAFSDGPLAWQAREGASADVPVILCPDEFFRRCGTVGGVALAVIDRATRVVAAWALSGGAADPQALAEAVLAATGGLPQEKPGRCALPAPLLPVPGLLDRALCRTLIERFEAAPNFDSLVSGASADGRAASRLDPGRKRRRDWLLAPGEGLYNQVHALLFRRCVPEIWRTCHCEVSHLDRVLVARYDDSGGYFRRHRDNMAPSVAFRQFALSVNLNAGAYQGGEIVFPEFNDHRYEPRTGEGLVFSASLLHEVLPVTQGQRYVLLTFLHDAAAEAKRAVS